MYKIETDVSDSELSAVLFKLLEFGYRSEMDFIGSISKAKGSRVSVKPGKTCVIRDTDSSMSLNSSINYMHGHVRSNYLDHSNILDSTSSSIFVNSVSTLNSQKTGLLNLDATLGNIMLNNLMLRDLFSESRSLFSSIAHEF